MKPKAQTQELKWQELLDTALTQPGKLEACFRMFHNYSFGNQLAAMFQCDMRGIEIGPMKTFKGWQELGRMVKKGEKALVLCQPLTSKREDKNGNEVFSTFFTWKPRWFTLSQTEGAEFDWSAAAPVWDKSKALDKLGIKEIPFRLANGNVQGYATRNNEVSINPLCPRPVSVMHHELGHIVLGHTKDKEVYDLKELDKSEIEVEAESVALLMLDTLGLDGVEFARGYIQHWCKTDVISEKSATRIIKATDTILRAGLPEREKKGQEE
jgi:antirestriction protein ArdC